MNAVDVRTDRTELLGLLRTLSLRRGEFVLSSGRTSTWYIDARITTMSGRGQVCIGRTGLAAITEAGWKPDAVGGLTLGADPIAYAIAHAAALDGKALDGFTVRKQPKTHGTGKRIEGAFPADGRVVVIEDTVTTGASTLDAIEVIRTAGASIDGVLALVDREEGGRERIEHEGLHVIALFTATELLSG